MSKFTKGPWKTEGGSCVIDSNGNVLVALVNGNVHHRDGAIDIADAHLIAAAPDLYSALEYMLTVCPPIDIHISGAEKALAKARGEL